MEQFNQQKGEDEEEDETETASGAFLGSASPCRTVSGLGEAVWADRRGLCCASGAASKE